MFCFMSTKKRMLKTLIKDCSKLLVRHVFGFLLLLQILFEAGENASGLNVAAFIDILTRRSGPQLCKSKSIIQLWLKNRFDFKSHTFITVHLHLTTHIPGKTGETTLLLVKHTLRCCKSRGKNTREHLLSH